MTPEPVPAGPLLVDTDVLSWIALGEGQNDTWIAACALSVEPPLPIVTGNLRDFVRLAEAAPPLRIVHPDL